MKTNEVLTLFCAFVSSVLGTPNVRRGATIPSAAPNTQVIPNKSDLIFYHGRWDDVPSSWWPGSGFKLAFANTPKSLTINVGSSAPSNPPITVSARFGTIGEWVTLNLTNGANAIPLTSVGLLTGVTNAGPRLGPGPSSKGQLVFDLVTQFEGGSARLELESVEVDSDAKLVPYVPSKYVFEFIGDSITAGFLSERGVVDDYSFKTSEYFHAEHNHIAQSGACLTDAHCWENPRGMSYLYFQTQNSYGYLLNNNVTTAWDFRQYKASPTHIFINIGTNDDYWGYNGTTFETTYINFLHQLRTIYPTQPIFVMSMFGLAEPTGVEPYFNEEDSAVVTGLNDKNVHLLNTTGWIAVGDTFPDFTHPTPNGHSKLAYHMIGWLLKWGLTPQ